tara:strand:- start:460 stop:1857 length:1398 start_codon:yes stop_codon:yes gene_type:complete
MKWLYLAACLGLASTNTTETPATDGEKARRPNVVILFTDDQGTLDARCFGSQDLQTPNIDKLAKTGVRFTQAYAHTVCCPARAALLTGRHPQRSGVNTWMQGDMKGKAGRNMALEEITLAETLKAAGYRTALFGKWHLGAHRDHGPMKQGFDEFFGIRDGFIDNFNHYFLHGDKGYHDLYEGTAEVTRKGDYFPEMVTSRSLEFIERNRDRPFFLYLGFNIPHYPEQALKEHAALYRELPMPRRSYAAIVTTTDHYIGKILDQLEKLNLRKDTIVIFQSDNGHSTESYAIRGAEHASGYPKGHRYGANGGGGNTGKWIGGKGTFLEGGIRTPAIISYPARLPQGTARDQVITVMDWYPTVLELCGIDPPKVTLDGRSVLPVVKDAKAVSKHETLYFQWQSRWAVRQGDWKLIGTRDRKGKAKLTLHQLTGKNPEKKNLAAKRPELTRRLHSLHEAWKKNVTPGSK